MELYKGQRPKSMLTPQLLLSSIKHALREKIEQDLERLEREGTIEPVQYSEWATPIVRVMKSDGTVRVCGVYKLTVNKVSKLDGYPIPKLADLYRKLVGGQTFTELDLSHAYEQMLVDENSKEFLTINTHKGLYRHNRLPYGVASAPENHGGFASRNPFNGCSVR